jgi:hypothetical protein
VFARQGVYHSPHAFVSGFTQALWVGAAFSVLGVLAAVLMPGRKRPDRARAVEQPALAFGGEPA